MAGPNLEIFKFSVYLFFPWAIMVHYGDPQWYHDNVLPIRDKFWPDESTLYVPPRNAADLKSELAELKAKRLTNKERKEQGLSPLPMRSSKASTDVSHVEQSLPVSSTTRSPISPSLREGGSLGITSMELARPLTASRTSTWRESWKEATERHVV
ncbi:hypothetical protein CBS101457_001186 [Exobasidium rhododendri]|nr:hypothetical protein CBS101457_001186 [Exobasidium rhododendri]